MPSHEQHLNQAKHNQELIGFIEANGGDDRFCDWCVTVAFYSALHYFEAVLPVVAPAINKNRQRGFVAEHYDGHTERLITMRVMFQDIYIPYSALYNRSRAAKYIKYATSPIVKSLAKKHLEEVIVECRKIMSTWKD
jgi:hypothetical protein